MEPEVMRTDSFTLLVTDEITRALMKRIRSLESANRLLRKDVVIDCRTIKRDVRAIRKQVFRAKP